jgi:hypothetical protein
VRHRFGLTIPDAEISLTKEQSVLHPRRGLCEEARKSHDRRDPSAAWQHPYRQQQQQGPTGGRSVQIVPPACRQPRRADMNDRHGLSDLNALARSLSATRPGKEDVQQFERALIRQARDSSVHDRVDKRPIGNTVSPN